MGLFDGAFSTPDDTAGFLSRLARQNRTPADAVAQRFPTDQPYWVPGASMPGASMPGGAPVESPSRPALPAQPGAALPLPLTRNVSLARGMTPPADPTASAPTAGPMPPTALPAGPAAADPSLLDRVMGGISRNSNALLGLAGGIAAGRNWGEGLGKGFTNAATLSQADSKESNMQATYAALRSALQARGYDPQQAHFIAQSAATNPKMLRAIGGALLLRTPPSGATGQSPPGSTGNLAPAAPPAGGQSGAAPAQAAAAAPAATAAPAAARMPIVGEVRDGFAFLGGHPGEPDSWTRLA